MTQILPANALQENPSTVLNKLKQGPVFLTQSGRGAAVMLSLQTWDQLGAELEQQQDVIDILEAYVLTLTGKNSLAEVDFAEIEKFAIPVEDSGPEAVNDAVPA